MLDFYENHRPRREFLWDMGAGFAGVALSGMLQADGFFKNQAQAAANAVEPPLSRKAPHFPVKAKSVIFLFMYGGPSQMDTFDYKPELQKRDGQEVKTEIRRRSIQATRLLASRRKFAQHGESGLWCSDAFPHIAKHMDELAVIKSLYADSFAHGSAMLQMNSGRIIQGYPSIGSWLNYGLGTENQNLPGYVVMLDPRGGPISGATNWSSGFMPASYQGTVFRSSGQPILNLAAPGGITSRMQREQIDTINRLNSFHMERNPGYSELQARISSYELAFQLQRTAPEALNLAEETEATQRMYGIFDPKPDHPLSIGPEHFGRQCLIARRLVERGVRFVQIYSGGGNQQTSWDAHFGMEENLKIHSQEVDRPIAGLLTDLKQRGLLDETLVIWGGEFGRQPVSQGKEHGRDHNPKGFTYWMAGGGVKKGISYGATDDLGMEAVENRHHIRDLHATILHLMGLDHEKLHYFYGGLEHKLTGVVAAEPIHGVIA
jgi:Arylsulfatase A and related enzymes